MAAAQVLRRRLCAEPAEVDDPLDALLLGHLREVARAARALAAAKSPLAAPSHRVDEVVGDRHALARALEARRARYVALVELEAVGLESLRLRRSRTRQRTARRRFRQGFGQPAADETRSSGNEAARRRSIQATRPGCKAKPVRVHLLERSQRVEVPVEQAFAFYGDDRNLEPLTPPWLHFEVTTPRPLTMGADNLLEYRLRLHGVPLRWRTRIETWEPPTRFVDFQEKGPYSLWEHTHLFEADSDDATVIHDRVRYALPLGPLGSLAHRLFVRKDLKRIFDYRHDKISKLLEPR